MTAERTTLIRASAPTRIDLAGGTLDIWPLYAFHTGCTVNLAVDLRANVTLAIRRDYRAKITSLDQQVEMAIDARRLRAMHMLPLIREVILHFWQGRSGGFELETSCEAPSGAGLGGSSALAIALCAAFARAAGRRLSPAQRVGLARDVEARVLGIPTGTQDYYSAIYGGLNIIQLGPGVERCIRARIDLHAVAARLVLVYSGTSRSSGINNWEVVKERIDGNRRVTQALSRIAVASVAMAEALANRSWDRFVDAMRGDWRARMRLARGILTPQMAAAIDVAKPKAQAWKACGAGGGGCLVFACAPERKRSLIASLTEAGFRVLDFAPAARGLAVSSRRMARNS
ncbi:MAG: GHMP kinase [Acidobacteriota bacterium]